MIDFREVKARVSLASVLARYRVETNGKEQGRADCVLPGHPEANKGTLSVNLERNLWKCFHGACPGRKGGNILDFVSLMEKCSIKSAAEKLDGWFSVVDSVNGPVTTVAEQVKPVITPVITVAEQVKPVITPVEEVNKPLGWAFKAENLDFEHPYVLSRISKETAEAFGAAAYKGPGKMMAGRMIIPIHDESGVLLGYAGRALNGQEPRYLLPAGLHKGLVLFNRHRVTGRSVVVVEGYVDCMRVTEAGYPCVALMGSSMSPAQEELLSKFERVIVFLDGDDAGKTGSPEIATKLSLRTFVRRVAVEGKQPDALSNEEIRKALT